MCTGWPQIRDRGTYPSILNAMNEKTRLPNRSWLNFRLTLHDGLIFCPIRFFDSSRKIVPSKVNPQSHFDNRASASKFSQLASRKIQLTILSTNFLSIKMSVFLLFGHPVHIPTMDMVMHSTCTYLIHNNYVSTYNYKDIHTTTKLWSLW